MIHTIRVRTTQNVFIEYPLASLGDRMVAYLIDSFILVAYILLCFLGFDLLEINDSWVNILVVTIPYLLYHLLFEMLMSGQSPGKRAMKIKVVRLDGSSPTIGNYLLRWLFRILEVMAMQGTIALVTIASSTKGQRLGDVVAGTSVVKLVKPEDTTADSVFTLVEDGYEPVFSQAIHLNDRDIEIIQQALIVNRQSGNVKPVMAVVEKLKALLNIETDLPPVKLLYTLIKDYSALTAAK